MCTFPKAVQLVRGRTKIHSQHFADVTHTVSCNHPTLVFTESLIGARHSILTIETSLGAFYVPGAGAHKDMAFLKNKSCVCTHIYIYMRITCKGTCTYM